MKTVFAYLAAMKCGMEELRAKSAVDADSSTSPALHTLTRPRRLHSSDASGHTAICAIGYW